MSSNQFDHEYNSDDTEEGENPQWKQLLAIEVLERPHKCFVCSKKFYRAEHLDQHLLIHTETNEPVPRRHICKVCHKEFTRRSTLKRHLKGHDPSALADEIYKCDLCEKQYSFKNNLTRHRKTHSEIKPYQCDICNKQFDRKFILDRHVLIHSGYKPYECFACNKKFSQQSSLDNHFSLHTGITTKSNEKIPCSLCNKVLNKNNMGRHLVTHKTEKPYLCLVCGKGFNQNINLKNHLSCHSDEKPYKCETCDKQFKLSKNLKQHACQRNSLSQTQFSQQTSLDNDFSLHTGITTESNEKIPCSLCNKVLNKNNMNRHLVTHKTEKPYLCPVCGKGFNQNINLKNHMSSHSDERPYKCEMCDKQFKLSQHLKQHACHRGLVIAD